MKRKSLLIMLLVALFVPLAMNAQNEMLKKKKSTNGSTQLEMMKVTPKRISSNPMLTKLESAKEAALEELNGRGVRADNELLTQDFESMSSISTTYSATGWYAYNAGSGNNWTLNSSSSYANSGSNSAQVQYSSRYAANCYLVSAPFTVSSSMSELTVSLYERVRSGSYAETFEVFFVKASDVSNLAGVASATKYNAIASASYTNTAFAQQSGTVTNSALAGQSVRVVVHCTSAADKYYLYIDDITVTEKTVVEGCSAPENFAASNETTNSVTLSWTETGTSDEWAVLYMCEEDEEAQIAYTSTNPFTLTGLNPATDYIAEVIPMCGDYDQESEVIGFTTLDLPCAKPTDLTASNLTPSSATVSWSGEADNYTLQYRPAAENGDASFFDDFESSSLNDWQWTTYTQGDAFSNYGWFAYNPQSLTTSFPTAYSGSTCAISLSYGNAALNANNYLVTPQVELGGTLKFWIMSNYADEYEVLLSTRGNAVANFTTTLKAMSAAPSSWTEVSIDLSAYAGQQGYIAIHHVFYDGWGLFLDDFGIYGSASDAGEWVTINNVTSPYTITGLDGETTYEWQVQGDCGSDGLSLWSSIATFTTPSACGTPTGLTTTDITNNSATLSWTEVLDAYNVRYRKGFVYDFESATPWAVDNFAPCTTYDGDQYGTYGFNSWSFPNAGYTGACIAFNNDNQGSDNMYSHSGNAFGVMFDAGSSSVQTNDWFILPELTIASGDVFSFWGREITDQYGAETINVGVYGSTNGTFSAYLAQNVSVSSTEWTEFSYDLSSYAGQTIKLAINCVSQDIFGFMFDDIFVGNPSNNWSTPVAVNGSTYALTGLDMETSYTWQVQGVDCDGNGGTTSWASAYFTTINGILVESITADPVTVTIGQTANITNLEVLPADATNPAVTYTSNNTEIATVTDAGVVTGVAVGTTTITIAATDGSNVSTTINVTVTGIDVTGITAEDVEVVAGETAAISYTVAPNNASDPSVNFTSANTAIATVDADGVVTGVSVGETTITIASVSNPDVTATITVTVTSNPNAVQFTVNAPDTAHPGDVITVDFMLAAPTTGTYTGFTGLDVNLYFETAAFQYNSKANGAVADAVSDIDMGQVSISGPNTNNPNRVKAILATPANYPVATEGIVFSVTFTVLQELGSYTFDAEINEFDYTTGEVGNSNTVDIPYEFTPSTVEISELETYILPISHWTYDENGAPTGYYLIASPIGDVAPADVTNMVTSTASGFGFDLYCFDQTKQNEWQNYKGHPFTLEAGKGYLYAHSTDDDLVFTGTAYNGDGVVELDYSEGEGIDFPGWNLVGNPFADQIVYIEDGRDFYIMDGGAEIILETTNNSIEPMEGIFVIAEDANDTNITFTTDEPSKSPMFVLNLGNGHNVIDRAIVRFGQGRQLPKFQLNKNHTKVYIPMDGHDYAVVRAEEMGAMPVNFKAENNGTYTLSFSSEEVSFAYLHLIDNMTGDDIDLLQTPSYSFEARTTDYESRFKLVFATGDNSTSDTFAFFSNGSFVINNDGEATLQVIDVNGRILKSESINGCANVNVNAANGVYMLRLINGDNVKVQKVVVK